MGKGRGVTTSQEEGIAVGADDITVMLTLSHVSNSLSRCHHTCFLVIRADRSLGDKAAQVQSKVVLPALTFRGL